MRCGCFSGPQTPRERGSRGAELEVVDDFILAVDELEAHGAISSLDQHGAVVPVVARLAARHRTHEAIYRTAPQAIDEVDDVILGNALISMIVTGKEDIGTPLGEGPLHPINRTMQPGREGRVVKIDHLPWAG